MKKIYLLAFTLGAFSLSTSYGQIDQQDDLESYSPGPISSQGDYWKTWSGEEGGPEDGIVALDQSNSGSQSLLIDEVGAPAGKDQLYLIDSQPDTDIYTVRFSMYIPSGKEGYFNLQGETPAGSQGDGSFLSPDIYFNPDNMTPGQGQVADGSATWAFPHDACFPVELILDLDNKTLQMNVDGLPAILEGTPFNDMAVPYFGAIDFYAPSEFTTYYIDDVVTAFGLLSTEDFKADKFSVYPNPVKDFLNIETVNAVDQVVIYDVLGKVVLQENPSTISPRINMSNLPTGAYLVKVKIGNSSKTVKVLK